MGFQSVSLQYIPNKRFAGKSKYNFWALLNVACMATIDFSDFPLRLGFYFSFFCFLLSGVSGALLISNYIRGNELVILYFISALVLFLFSLSFCMASILGIYIRDIQKESKKRPIYIIRDGIN